MAPIGRNTYQMVATSGVQHSPGPPPLGDAHGIVPVQCHVIGPQSNLEIQHDERGV
jgi:hypothetical protein